MADEAPEPDEIDKLIASDPHANLVEGEARPSGSPRTTR
jgi:hypothetical protein